MAIFERIWFPWDVIISPIPMNELANIKSKQLRNLAISSKVAIIGREKNSKLCYNSVRNLNKTFIWIANI